MKRFRLKYNFVIRLILVVMFFIVYGIANAQIIFNPSFEIIESELKGWVRCHELSTPDIQPGAWNVVTPASDGHTYIGLVARGETHFWSNTVEDVETRLVYSMVAGSINDFKIDLASSKKHGHYIDLDNGNSVYQLYDTPAKLLIYGASNSCDKTNILWESPPIDHTGWKTYSMRFEPENDINYLILEVNYVGDSTYFGNILIDNFVQCFIDLQVPSDTTICTSEPFIYNVSFPNGNYLWQDGSTGSKLAITTAGNYSVEVSNQCASKLYKFNVHTVESCNCYLTAPNVFTPNGDGVNEVFEVNGTPDIAKFNLQIFNRWGKLVYESDKIAKEWDGTSNGFQVPTGVYYWRIGILCIEGNSILDNSFNGYITVLR